MYDFPCAMHGDNYDDIVIAIDENHLTALHTDGYLTSAEWYAKHLNVVKSDSISETPKRGRKPKSESSLA